MLSIHKTRPCPCDPSPPHIFPINQKIGRQDLDPKAGAPPITPALGELHNLCVYIFDVLFQKPDNPHLDCSPSFFTDTRLPHENSIRLIQFSLLENNEVHLHIENFHLTEAPLYHAISYAWGSAKIKSRLYVTASYEESRETARLPLSS
jgi:hypothetical protein